MFVTVCGDFGCSTGKKKSHFFVIEGIGKCTGNKIASHKHVYTCTAKNNIFVIDMRSKIVWDNKNFVY